MAPYTDTRTCSAAYTGQTCSACATGYYMLNGQCYFCGSSVNQDSTIILTLLVSVGAMAVLALAVALLPARPLSRVIQIFTLLQSIAVVGVSGAKDSPYFTEKAIAAMTYLNLINFGTTHK